MKTINPPRMDAFDALIEQARQQAEAAGLNKSAIAESVKKARIKTHRGSPGPQSR